MKTKNIQVILATTVMIVAFGGMTVTAQSKQDRQELPVAPTPKQDKYTLKVPKGLAFSEFRGFESWETINVSHSGPLVAVTLGNPQMIDAFKSGIPSNGKPFPDGAKMTKIHWTATKKESTPGQPTVGGALHDVDFMVKDSKRFADGGGWGYAAFNYDGVSDTFTPQGNDAKCGVGCHTIAKKQDYVFTEYGNR